MNHLRTLRQELVRAAGRHRQPSWIVCAMMIDSERARAAFGDALSSRFYGQAPKRPRRKVSVPRRLRRMFGRHVEVVRIGGRKRKDRRKHNRRWMPDRDDCP